MSCWAGGRAPDTGGRAVAAAATGTGDGRAESVATRLPKWRPARRNSTPGPCTARHSLQKACLARGPVCRSDQQRPALSRHMDRRSALLLPLCPVAARSGGQPSPADRGRALSLGTVFLEPRHFRQLQGAGRQGMHALEPRPLGLQRPCRFVRKGRDRAPCAPARTATASGHAEGAGRNAAARTRTPDAGSFHNRLRNGVKTSVGGLANSHGRPSTGRRFPVYPRGPGPPSADHRAFHRRWNGRPPLFQAEAHAQAERRKTRVLVQHLQGDMPSARPTLPAVWRRAWRFSVRSPSKADRRRARSPLAGGHAQSAQVGGGGGSPQCRPYHD